jgi:DNA-directed RNA polymerase sigma subunit (sigma70/sigma32)
MTLEELSGVYDVSRERIRQIEVRAFEKLQKRMRDFRCWRARITCLSCILLARSE